MDDYKTFQEIFKEELQSRHLSLAKLSELTGIPTRYLQAFSEGDYKNLPPAPYIRGYLTRISEIFGKEEKNLWQIYKQEWEEKNPIKEDKMPSNRFAYPKISRIKWAVIFFIFLGIIYLGYREKDFFGTPSIEIINPSAESVMVMDSTIDLKGKISPRDKLTVNGENVDVESNGYFEKKFSLNAGLNTIEFKVKKLLGGETKVIRQVILNK